MHANFKELLSLRDGEPIAADVASHISTCAECSHELTRLRKLALALNQLPQYEPPAHAWQNIRGQLEQLQRRRARGLRIYFPAAAAAACAVIVLAVLWSAQSRPVRDPIGELVQRSQQLEAVLGTLPQRPTVERAATSATIDELQTRIQMLDLQLSDVTKNAADHDQAQRLWSTRVALLDSLVSVRYAEAARNGYRIINTADTGAI